MINYNLLIILSIIIIIIYNIYLKLITPNLTDLDKEDLSIMYELTKYLNNNTYKPKQTINDYTFDTVTGYNIVYKDNKTNTVKFGVRGTLTVTDLYTDIQCYFSQNAIMTSPIFINSKDLLKNYKNYNIYLIGHSLGAAVANRLANLRKNYNIVKCKLYNPFFGFEKVQFYHKKIIVVHNYYDIVPQLAFSRKLIPPRKIIDVFKSLPLNSFEFVLLHKIEFFYKIYNDNFLFILDIVVLVIFYVLIIRYKLLNKII